MKKILSRVRVFRMMLFASTASSLVLVTAINLVRSTPAGFAANSYQQVLYTAAAILTLILLAASLAFSVFSFQHSALSTWIAASAVFTAVGTLPALAHTFQALSPGPGMDLSWMHFLSALVGMGLSITALLYFYRHQNTKGKESSSPLGKLLTQSYTRLSLLAVVFGLAVIVSGVNLSTSQAAPSCPDWPLCNGFSLALSPAQGFVMLHRVFVAATMIILGILLVRAWRQQRWNPLVLTAATAAGALYFSQAVLGGLLAGRGNPIDLVILHSAVAAAAWGTLVLHAAGTLLFSPNLDDVKEDAVPPLPLYRRAKDFLLLTKPVIVLLLLVTTYAGMVVGGRSIPSLGLTLWTLFAGALAAGGSGAINQYIDRELDQHMQRTARRPLPSGRVTPAEGLAFGVALLVVAFFLMAAFTNLLAALLSLAGMVYYILIYSILLKKATVQNIVIGGGAGAIPPLVGWAAASGGLSVPALFLFAIIFLWTPPHFWALALVRRKDYARAGVPMLPVVRGEKATQFQILVYSIELVVLTLLMPALKLAGSLFLISAVVLGGALIFSAWRVYRQGGNKRAWQMYRYSSMYLAFIFVALVMDVLI